MNKPFPHLKTSCLIILLSLLATFSKAGNLTEENSINISNYEIHHQGINSLNIILTWKMHLPLGLNLSKIFYEKADSFLKAYPNKTDWWEIVNKGLTRMLMNTYPDIDSLASDIEVTWVSGAGVVYGHRYPTRCVTCRTNTGKLYEYFGFRTLKDYKICVTNNQCYLAHLDVLYRYKEHIADKDYPDGLATENSFKDFLKQFIKTESFARANNNSAEELIKKFPEIAEISSRIELDLAGYMEESSIILKR